MVPFLLAQNFPQFLSSVISREDLLIFFSQQGTAHHIVVVHLHGEVVIEHDGHQRLALISENL